jgi:predicted DNA-binding protein YlxM (UPF0122 family)
MMGPEREIPMKSTDINRIDRDLKQARKKQEIIEKRIEGREGSVGDYIKRLVALLFHDQKKIYNLKGNESIRKLFEDLKQHLPEAQWENVVRKAVRETKVEQREEACSELRVLLQSV